MKTRCMIVDDEAPARARLARMLALHDQVELVGEAADGQTALDEVLRLQPDLIFLDIEMPQLDGLGVAAALGSSGPAIIFASAYDEHAVRAFELSAVDYLVKPVSKARLEVALKKVTARGVPSPEGLVPLLQALESNRTSRRMAIRCGAKYLVFDPSRVSAILARDHYSAVLVDGHELLADDSLDELTRRFDPQQFLRIHRSAIINVAFLRELVGEGDRHYVAVLNDPDATRVPVSRDRLATLKAVLGIA